MKISVAGKIRKDVESLKRQIKLCNYSVVNKNPDVVISLGGDGSFLIAERLFPSVPKIAMRDKSVCHVCGRVKLRTILRKLRTKRYKIETHQKIEANIRRKVKIIKKKAANDIVVRNKDPYHALRFRLKINNKPVNKIFIGDGIVTATSFGSTGYFHSVSRTNFKKGFGLAFNNTTKKHKPIFLKKGKAVIEILRNTAIVCDDNDRNTVLIGKGDKVEIGLSKEKLKIIRMR